MNVSSLAATHVSRWQSAYGAAKAGVDMLTRVAADELGPHGIRVNAVLPGLVTTETTSPLTEDEVVRRTVFLRRDSSWEIGRSRRHRTTLCRVPPVHETRRT